MIAGIFESHVKGIPTALEASKRLRAMGLEPHVVAAEIRRCDLLVFPSGAAEGFGLPVLEAMAAMVPWSRRTFRRCSSSARGR